MTHRSILHVSQPTDAGVARCVTDLAADQARRGWRVTVACPSDGGLAARVSTEGVSHRAWEADRTPGATTPAETLRLRRIVRHVRPDVVHLHSSKAGLAGRLAVRGRVPTVFHPNAWSWEAVTGALRAASRGWERLGGRWADVIVCVSEAEREAARAARIRARLEVVCNGVDLDLYRPAGDDERRAARIELDLDECPLAVCVGRLSHQKGQDVLLRAWPPVLEVIPEAQLALVGDGPDRAALEALAPPGTRMDGWSENVAAWLAAADVIVQPSRWEGMSYTVLEAMARARSVVATDVAGSRELLGADAGAVVPVEDVAALAAALVLRLNDSARVAAEGRAGRERAERAHDLDACAESIASLYADVLARRR